MPAPSRRSGLPATLVALLLAVIFVAGFGLGPRAFEFRAWPQPAHDQRVEEVVTRSAEDATEVPLVRVRRDERARGRDGTLAVRGRSPRRRSGSADPTLDVRSGGGREDSPRGPRPRGRGDGGETATPVPDVVIVDETVPPKTGAPATEPDEPTQLAELAEPQPVLRPDPQVLPSVQQPRPAPSETHLVDIEVDVDVDGVLDEVEGLVDGLLPGKHGRDGRGRHGHR